MKQTKQQQGFTLIEIAIVLVIIGLLLGGVLKGQELITSARVRNIISTQDGIKAAYFGFLDRYRALPGDYTQAASVGAVIGNINGATQNGNGNGRVETAGAVVAASVPQENILAWEHISRAGFMNGTYTFAAAATTATSPTNPYGVLMDIAYDGIYGAGTVGTPSAARHNIKSGGQIPVEIIVEVDRKIDDGAPNTGGFQFSRYQGNAAAAPTDGAAATPACTSATTPAGVWNTTNGSTNCGGASLL